MGDSRISADVLIVGGGFGGLYSVWKFRNLGFQVHLFEAASSFGGVWHHNAYPGARVDSEFPFYQLSIPEVYKTWNFSERFPDHNELRRYFQHADRVLDVSRDTTFQAEVVDAQYDEAAQTWTVQTKEGHVAMCRYLILCTGSTYRKYIPQFANMAGYRGHLHHTSKWPSGGLDVKGKDVCVIGAGATAIQVVQEFAKEVNKMTVLIRTPNVAFPLRQREISHQEQYDLKGWYDSILRTSCRNSAGGFPYNIPTTPFSQTTSQEREALYEELYERGGFSPLAGVYGEIMIDQEANRSLYDFWAKKTRARITNPAKRDLLAPLEPRHAILSKRSSLEIDYYECMDQKNVRIIDLSTIPIRTFTEHGLRIGKDNNVEDIEADAIVLATGYDNYTGAFQTMGLKDVQGNHLRDRWKNGVQTYLGLMCNGHPNMWFTYGPQAPTAIGNGPTIIETQIDIIADMIMKMRDEGISSINPTATAAQEWTDDIHATSEATLMNQADSWYMGANVEGKKREMLNYLKGLVEYERSCRATLPDWKGFEVVRSE